MPLATAAAFSLWQQLRQLRLQHLVLVELHLRRPQSELSFAFSKKIKKSKWN
jgi:hypothetical protein